jgi:hypothetical protein
MTGKSGVYWSIKELRDLLIQRQHNEYDANIGVSGKRGDGKSTFLLKLFLRFEGFNEWKHQVYSRDDVIDLLKNQMLEFCWDDEGINTGYKRDFQQTGQKDLIKIVTAYRDNFNIYATAIPFFYSLDKDLRELIFLHVHIIERGFAVLFLPLEDTIHQQDPWDSKNNAKLEEKWQRRKQENPDFRFPYHKLSTFAGYLFFNDVTEKQRLLYKEIKKFKREDKFKTEAEKLENKEKDFHTHLLELVMAKKISKEGLMQVCLTNHKQYSSLTGKLNSMLKDLGHKETLSDFLVENVEAEKVKEELDKLIPDV